jgi:hypothetical protein
LAEDDDTPRLACAWCASTFRPTRSDQAYCGSPCNKAAATLELRRARRIYRAIYHWRLQRKSFGANMAFVCREVAAWIREDRAAQRKPPPPHDHESDRGHERARPGALPPPLTRRQEDRT